jgi:hypothetical protein
MPLIKAYHSYVITSTTGKRLGAPYPSNRPVTLPEPVPTSAFAAMDIWALNLKAGGSCLTPRHPLPTTSTRLAAAGGIGSLALGATRLKWQSERWPRLAVSASGRKNSRDDGDDPKNKASSSGRFFWPSSDAVDVDLCDLSGGICRIFAISMRGYGRYLYIWCRMK